MAINDKMLLLDYELEILKKNNYLLCGGSFFSIKTSCFLVVGLYFFFFSLFLSLFTLSWFF